MMLTVGRVAFTRISLRWFIIIKFNPT